MWEALLGAQFESDESMIIEAAFLKSDSIKEIYRICPRAAHPSGRIKPCWTRAVIGWSKGMIFVSQGAFARNEVVSGFVELWP